MTLQRCQDDWAEGVVALDEAYQYLEGAKKPYNSEQVGRLARDGSQLAQRAGVPQGGNPNPRTKNAPYRKAEKQ